MNEVRLDVWLVQHGLAGGRDKAKELLAAGYVTVNGQPVSKPSRGIGADDRVVCSAPADAYVGRGGYKLEKMLQGQSLTGQVCMDVGASTGGFTDCMLQHGAAHVYAVDVGRDQLHASLRADPRVTVLEETDVRSDRLRAAVPAGSLDLAVVDVSFVSLIRVLPAVLPFLKPEGWLVCLIKPQFEAGRSGVGKRGIVKDPAVHRRVLTELLAFFRQMDLTVQRLTDSPITGGEGNIEYLVGLRRSGGEREPVWDIPSIVAQAFQSLRR